jgi:hypothetical protein
VSTAQVQSSRWAEALEYLSEPLAMLAYCMLLSGRHCSWSTPGCSQVAQAHTPGCESLPA